MRYIVLFIFLFELNCTRKIRNDLVTEFDVVQKLYSSKTRTEHLTCLGSNYQLFFGEVKGPGISKAELSEMLTWDYNLNTMKTILDTIYYSSDSIVVLSKEENDFSRLIGFPGWISRNSFNIKDNLIQQQLYVPMDKVSYNTYLKPAVNWLVKNDSLELSKVYDFENGSLIKYDSASAIIWKKLLQKWKETF